jgi:transposase InsO family protein
MGNSLSYGITEEVCNAVERDWTHGTGYKWIVRYDAEGLDGLRDQSRAPHNHPNAVAEEIEALIVRLRKDHPRWGPKKLLPILQQDWPGLKWPARSTVEEILKRHGLVRCRRRSRKTPPYEQPFAGLDQPNAVWRADLKGWFVTGDGERCDPLTITDNYSRYLLCCQIVRPATHETIHPVFETVFREYGLPAAIRTDNGPPFATTTVGGLSRLSIWWLRLGILPERIEPGKPQQNGRHERMHRTLKDETALPPKSTWRRQQAAFDRFCQEFNHQRPHESLGQQTPASHYQSSLRRLPLLPPEMTYPDDMQTRRVKGQGDISWKSRHVYLSKTLAGETVGLCQITDDRWDIYFGHIRLAQLDSKNRRLMHLKRTKKREIERKKVMKKYKKVLPMCPVYCVTYVTGRTHPSL